MAIITGLARGPDIPNGRIAASSPSEKELLRLPGVLRHLYRLTDYLPKATEPTAYIAIYARRPGQRHGERLHELAPPLDTFTAQDSGVEGIACVDDVARAVNLALRVYELTPSEPVQRLAEEWLRFVVSMQRRDDYRMLNFILDEQGTKSQEGQTSYPGGEPWTIRALRAYALSWRVLRDKDALRRFQRTFFPVTGEMQYVAEYALATMDYFETRPQDGGLRTWIEIMCQLLMDHGVTHGPGYFLPAVGAHEVPMYGYYQLAALARAGRLLAKPEYIAACEQVVANVIEPVIREGFYHIYPTQRDHQSVFDISPMAQGLEALFYATENPRYRELALRCCAWLDGANPAGAAVYDPETGRCHDNVNLQGQIAPTTGAESAIEAGLLQLVRCRLDGVRAGVEAGQEDRAKAKESGSAWSAST
jgi:hypothetical protein